jgi:6-phosphogluconolactonase
MPSLPPTSGGRRGGAGLLLAAVLVLAGCAQKAAAPTTPQGPTPRNYLYVGTSAGDIQLFELDLAVGALTARGHQSVASAPVALAGDRDGHVLVAALERGSTVLSFAIDPASGRLKPRGRAGSGGSDPARAILDASGKYALVSNRGSGNVSVLAIKPDRTLDTAETFASGRGPHGLVVHPGNQFAFVANLRAGTLSQFTFNAGTGRLTPKLGAVSGMPWDSGPRQIVCHPNGRFTYVLNEGNDTISVHAFDDRMASLSHMAFQVISTLPEGVPGASSRAADLQIDPRGLYLYASNNGHDSLATFAIDPVGGGLRLVGHQSTGGKGVTDLAIDPGGRYLVAANSRSRSVTLFRLDEATGSPSRLADTAVPAAPRALHLVRAVPET